MRTAAPIRKDASSQRRSQQTRSSAQANPAAAAPSPDGIAVQRQPTSPADPVSRPVDESGRRAILEEVQRASSQPRWQPPQDSPPATQGAVQRASGPSRFQPTREDPQRIHQAATRGLSGPGGPLPYLEQIQAAFGAHDLSGVRAYTGSAATAAAREMGASAYAKGKQVAFAGTPSLRTVAHEAAHTVQQRAGVQLEGGVGQVGDPYEQQADRVADAVVAGRSAEPLLPAPPLDHHGQAASAPAPVQRMASEDAEILKKVVDFFTNVEPIMFANLTSINYDLIDWNGLYKFIESEIKENEKQKIDPPRVLIEKVILFRNLVKDHATRTGNIQLLKSAFAESAPLAPLPSLAPLASRAPLPSLAPLAPLAPPSSSNSPSLAIEDKEAKPEPKKKPKPKKKPNPFADVKTSDGEISPFQKEFSGPSVGLELEIKDIYCAQEKPPLREFAEVRRTADNKPILLVTKDMESGPYAPKGEMAKKKKKKDKDKGGPKTVWCQYGLELVSHPWLRSDEKQRESVHSAVRWVMEVFTQHVMNRNHLPLEPQQDDQFELLVFRREQVIFVGGGDYDGSRKPNAPLSAQQATLGEAASAIRDGKSLEAQLIRSASWYQPKYELEAEEKSKDEAVKAAYAFLKSVMVKMVNVAWVKYLPIGNWRRKGGDPPADGWSDSYVKNEWHLLPRSAPVLILDGLSGTQRGLVLELLKEAPADLPDVQAWGPVCETILQDRTSPSSHPINSAKVGGEQAMLFEYRKDPPQAMMDEYVLDPAWRNKKEDSELVQLLAKLNHAPNTVANIRLYAQKEAEDYKKWFVHKYNQRAQVDAMKIASNAKLGDIVTWLAEIHPDALKHFLSEAEKSKKPSAQVNPILGPAPPPVAPSAMKAPIPSGKP